VDVSDMRFSQKPLFAEYLPEATIPFLGLADRGPAKVNAVIYIYIAFTRLFHLLAPYMIIYK
jgi:hypothetical protein